MWIKIDYGKGSFEHEQFKSGVLKIEFNDSSTAPIAKNDSSIRLSRIFPLLENHIPDTDVLDIVLYFFEYKSAFTVLGKIKRMGSVALQESIYFSYGACSVIMVCRDEKIKNEFVSLELGSPKASEVWKIRNGLVEDIFFTTAKPDNIVISEIEAYDALPIIEKGIIDEFAISVKLLESSINSQDDYNVEITNNLISIVNIFIKELKFLHTLKGDVPNSLITADIDRLRDPLENQILRQQNIDRLIQINSAISYVSTQSYSGSIPILERRSLIRRSSLLGIGNAIKSLNRIVDYIEDAFDDTNLVEIITEMMKSHLPLPGLQSVIHDRSEWYKKNIDTLNCKVPNTEKIKKLAYFSSRQAYRESEYAITASLNSVTTGLSLEWPLITITHEMLHSYVRIIMVAIFFNDKNSEIDNYREYYTRYENKLDGKQGTDYGLLDSVRECIFTYCLKTLIFGSLTKKKEYKPSYETKGAKFYLVKFEDFYTVFQDEYRNLNEIFVHVFDLHYFYGGRITKYIPIIWYSWSAVPHVSADIRQYILRSLLAIASKIDQDPYERFNLAVQEFRDIINEHIEVMSDIPLIKKVIEELENVATLKKYYFGAFKSSLIIVDLAMDVFFSKKVNQKLWEDDKIEIESRDDRPEDEFIYDMTDDFVEGVVDSPVPYLFDRMNRILKNGGNLTQIERVTAIAFLAINSKS